MRYWKAAGIVAAILAVAMTVGLLIAGIQALVDLLADGWGWTVPVTACVVMCGLLIYLYGQDQ